MAGYGIGMATKLPSISVWVTTIGSNQMAFVSEYEDIVSLPTEKYKIVQIGPRQCRQYEKGGIDFDTIKRKSKMVKDIPPEEHLNFVPSLEKTY